MALAGPKPDRFIFWTIDLLILTIGATIIFGLLWGDLNTAAFLGLLSALTFAGVELAFAGRISRWFWADFAIEVVIASGLAVLLIARLF